MRSTVLPLTDTMVTPSANEMRKNAASEASSRKVVAPRDQAGADGDEKSWPARPPPAIANTLKPAIRNPIATPGKIACDSASPIRLMRRSIKNTPIGRRAERQRKRRRPAPGA